MNRLRVSTFTAGERLTHAVAQVLNVKLFHQLVGAILTLLFGEVVTDGRVSH
jgi:hypothetical protein